MGKNLLPNTVHIKLEAFEGPFDLLFHLIEKDRINLYDIPIADLTDQYMEVIREALKGQHQGAPAMALVKAVPFRVRLSMFGVLTFLSPIKPIAWPRI